MEQWVGYAHGEQVICCAWQKRVGRFDFRGGQSAVPVDTAIIRLCGPLDVVWSHRDLGVDQESEKHQWVGLLCW